MSWWLLVSFLLAPALACGSFAPRPTPSPTPTPTWLLTPLWLPELPTATPTPTPRVPTPTPTPRPTLEPGKQAWVLPGHRVNVRNQPSVTGAVIGQLAGGAIVNVLEGPITRGTYRWWRVDDRFGLEGWVAEGDAEEQWLVPLPLATPTPAAGRVGVGSIVVVNIGGANRLVLRTEPDVEARIIGRYPPGKEFKVLDGPVVRDGLVWWRVEGPGGVVGWMAEGGVFDRWLIPKR